ncbi:MAG TPA: glycine C-acetyltransferase [Bacteroidia bacterium]|jgi:glycine C-acetyltransferase|nr:glycine C-acetyltransferase [Bacteroidia bacterium]
MYTNYKEHLETELRAIEEGGLFKKERIITTEQGAVVRVSSGEEVIIFCANNYLGLSSHPKVIEAAHKTLDNHGYGMSSVRFICGTQDIHKTLEKKISSFLGQEDTILYAACFDANGGVFEPLLGENDAVISDELNHASIIDGIRLCKAQRYRYKNSDMSDLEEQLKKAQSQRFRMIVTDGVFSMDGYVAPLDKICDLADKYNALVMVDESHATGFIGKTGRGTIELKNVMHRVDIVTGTLGKALGGAMGGFTSGKKEIISLLRQRSRPYLFSNSLAPHIVGASIAVFDMLSHTTELRDKLEKNIDYFKKGIKAAGLEIRDGDSAIVPVMLYDAKLSQIFADKLLQEGIYVTGFFFPVVPKGQARIRVQLSAAHEKHHLDKAIAAFSKIGKELGVIK